MSTLETSGARPTLLEEVIRIKREKEAIRLNEEQAQAMLPDFRFQLSTLITAKLPPPEVRKGSFEEAYRSGIRRNELKTQLTAIVPYEDGKVNVDIFASAYPDLEDPQMIDAMEFSVDVKGLDRVLVVKEGVAIIEAKKRYHISTIMASDKYWPVWSRRALVEDLEDYQRLIVDLNKDDVTFTGSTPPKIEIIHYPIKYPPGLPKNIRRQRVPKH